MQKQVKIKQEFDEQSLMVEPKGFGMKALSRADKEASEDESSGEQNSQYSETHADDTGYNVFLLSDPDFIADVKSDGNSKEQCNYEGYSHSRSRNGKKKRKESLQSESPGGTIQAQTEIKEEVESSSDQEDQGRYFSFVFAESLNLETYIVLGISSGLIKTI